MPAKPVFTRSIYLSGQEAIFHVNEFLKVAEREKKSFNELILEALKEFNRRHGEGNVTFKLDGFGVTWTKAIPAERGLLTRQILENYPTEELERFLEGAVKETTLLRHLILEKKKSRASPEERMKQYLKAVRS